MAESVDIATTGAGGTGRDFQSLEALLHSTLRIDPARITDDLSYQDISEWDSLGHVRLMQAVETAYSFKLSSELITQLTSVRALRAFTDQVGTSGHPAPGIAPKAAAAQGAHAQPAVSRGLVGVCFDRSEITEIDASGGMLRYRGYGVDELVQRASFEEVSFLLVHGHVPSRPELERFQHGLQRARNLPAALTPLLASVPGARPFLVMQAAVAALGAFRADHPDADIDLIAQVSCALGLFHRLRSGVPEPQPLEGLGHAQHLLYNLHGRLAQPAQAQALDKALILLADHSSSASTFAARVATGAKADAHAAVSSAIGAFSGPLHGGAIDQVMAMVDEIGTPDNAADIVRRRLSRNEIVYGFGHRIYRSADPRSRLLRDIARGIQGDDRSARTLDILDAIAAALSGYSRLGLDMNVDFYASALFEALGIPRDLFGPVFVSARVAGLVAHVREQRRNNVLIRPQLLYSGSRPRSYAAGAQA